MPDHRVIVVGLGGLGSAALYRLAADLGSGVLGIEQFGLGHDRGASQDHSRIIRLAQHQAPYATLAAPAYRAWDEVESASGQRLVTRTGGLVIEDRVARRDAATGSRNIEGYTAMFDRFGVAYELLDADELVARWPQFRVGGGELALYQAESGIVDAARANAVHRALARAHGAEIRANTAVRALRADGAGVAVETDTGILHADRVVVAADAWTNQVLAGAGVTLPLTVLQEQVTYYATPHLAEFAPSRFPVFMWHGRDNFYGFPVYGEVATKLGQHMGGPETTAETRTFEPDPVRQARYADFVAQHIPRFGGPELTTRTCLYTVPPDQNFILDRLPDTPQIIVAIGAGHAFKFVALIGRLLADLAQDRPPAQPIDAFSITRPALTDPSFPGASMYDHVDPYAALPARPLDPARFTEESTYAPTRLPVELASTLIPDAYTSPDFFALERERVFANSWVAVGMASDVDRRPGACLVVEVAGRSIVITRNTGGALRAFHNVCRHRATRLLDADARDVGRHGRIRCPYHSWTYDTDGACLGTPLFEDSGVPVEERPIFDTAVAKGFDRADYGLLPVAVDTWGCFLFVHLGADPPPLTEQLGDLSHRFRDYRLDAWLPRRRRTYDVAANYKLVGENFMEYYHLPSVHPELSRVSRFADHYRWQGPGMYTGMCTTPVSRNTEAGGWDGLRPLSSLSGTDADSGRFVWLFPGTALSVLPNHAFVLLNRPVGPDRTVETAVLLSHPEALDDPGAAAGIDQLAAFWDLVNRQDLEIVERVQEGLGNPAYRGGRMCYRFEEPLHRFQNMIIDRILGVDRVPAGDDDRSEVNLAARDR